MASIPVLTDSHSERKVSQEVNDIGIEKGKNEIIELSDTENVSTIRTDKGEHAN